jgi:hypothetical protein
MSSAAINRDRLRAGIALSARSHQACQPDLGRVGCVDADSASTATPPVTAGCLAADSTCHRRPPRGTPAMRFIARYTGNHS